MGVVVGIDEVGRGCWAGPVVAGAVALLTPIGGLRDSKKLTKRFRENLSQQIHAEALAVGLGWVEPKEIDEIGLTRAVGLAMERAMAEIMIDFDEIIIDGNYNFLAADKRARAVIQADDSVPSVSAASIIAKVARDNYMTDIAQTYAGYGFDRHVGYGTAAHIAALKKFGVTDMHRRSYKPIQAFLP